MPGVSKAWILSDQNEVINIESDPKSTEQFRKLLSGLLLGLLMLAFYTVCSPFLKSVAWAAIVVLGAWPLHSRLRARWPRWPGITSAITTLLMAFLLLALSYPIIKGLGPEIKSAGEQALGVFARNQGKLEQRLSEVPLIGVSLARSVSELKNQTADLVPLLQDYAKTAFGTATVAAQGLLSFLFQFGVFVMAVFFFLYHGEDFTYQLRTALLKMDPRTERLLLLVQNTVTGVLYGLILTALAQGVLAGIGFAVAGVNASTLLGLATAFLSFIPYGPQAVYIPVSLALALGGSPLKGILLALWGILVVSSADNVIKPLFIARQVKLQLPLTLLGVIGGVLGFGLLGVFIGPVVVGLVKNLWLAWTDGVLLPEEQDVALSPASQPEPEPEPPEELQEDETEEALDESES